MIFLTVGTQLPFDRLVSAVDSWCESRGRSDVFGQIADPGPGGFLPSHFDWQNYVEPEEFQNKFNQADMIIAHAGMGAIITALTLAKPLVIMPRKASLKEHRNEHQLGTAQKFVGRAGIHVAEDEIQLPLILDGLMSGTFKKIEQRASQFADPGLIRAVRDFIFDN